MYRECTYGETCCPGSACYRKEGLYSQCLQSCPTAPEADGRYWDCLNDSSSPVAPLPSPDLPVCAANGARCDGSTGKTKCCSANRKCFQATTSISICRKKCKQGWLCETNRRSLFEEDIDRSRNDDNNADVDEDDEDDELDDPIGDETNASMIVADRVLDSIEMNRVKHTESKNTLSINTNGTNSREGDKLLKDMARLHAYVETALSSISRLQADLGAVLAANRS